MALWFFSPGAVLCVPIGSKGVSNATLPHHGGMLLRTGRFTVARNPYLSKNIIPPRL